MWLVLNSCYQVVRASARAEATLDLPQRQRSIRGMIDTRRDNEHFTLHGQAVRTQSMETGVFTPRPRYAHCFFMWYRCRDGESRVYENVCSVFRTRKSGLYFILVIRPTVQ